MFLKLLFHSLSLFPFATYFLFRRHPKALPLFILLLLYSTFSFSSLIPVICATCFPLSFFIPVSTFPLSDTSHFYLYLRVLYSHFQFLSFLIFSVSVVLCTSSLLPSFASLFFLIVLIPFTWIPSLTLSLSLPLFQALYIITSYSPSLLRFCFFTFRLYYPFVCPSPFLRSFPLSISPLSALLLFSLTYPSLFPLPPFPSSTITGKKQNRHDN